MSASTTSFTLVHSVDLPNGARAATFACVPTNVYLTGGMTADVSAYFSGSPTCLSGVCANGILFAHNAGTSAAGKVVLFKSNAQCSNASNQAASTFTCMFIGTPDLS